MFTGIVEEVGTIRELCFHAGGAAITVAANRILSGSDQSKIGNQKSKIDGINNISFVNNSLFRYRKAQELGSGAFILISVLFIGNANLQHIVTGRHVCTNGKFVH